MIKEFLIIFRYFFLPRVLLTLYVVHIIQFHLFSTFYIYFTYLHTCIQQAWFLNWNVVDESFEPPTNAVPTTTVDDMMNNYYAKFSNGTRSFFIWNVFRKFFTLLIASAFRYKSINWFIISKPSVWVFFFKIEVWDYLVLSHRVIPYLLTVIR